MGGIDDALAAAAKRANVENYTIISYPEKESLFMNLLNSQRKHYVNSQMKEYMGSFYSYFEILQNLKEINPVQARMPFELIYLLTPNRRPFRPSTLVLQLFFQYLLLTYFFLRHNGLRITYTRC